MRRHRGWAMVEQVSVIIPAYNAERYLTVAVESVKRQRHEPIEIIVVDDGSTDGTLELAEKLPGVRCVRQNNLGAAAARNAGVIEVKGEFLAFLDADDLWADGKLAAQLAALRDDPTIHLVAGRVEEFYDEDAQHIAQRGGQHWGDRAYTIGALLLRRSDFWKVGLFDPGLRFGEFMDWRSRALALGLHELVLDQVVLRRRIHNQNTTRLAQDHKSHYLAAIRAHLRRKQALSESASPDKSGGSP
jgi:glycosyltransferase involved in cell wall biosynthesis